MRHGLRRRCGRPRLGDGRAGYSIADISLLGWVRNLIGFYEARELVGFDRFLHVQAWLNRGLARPAVQRGLDGGLGRFAPELSDRLHAQLLKPSYRQKSLNGAALNCV
jgi:hypothetical protein